MKNNVFSFSVFGLPDPRDSCPWGDAQQASGVDIPMNKDTYVNKSVTGEGLVRNPASPESATGVEYVEINLEPLYEYNINTTSEKLLELILLHYDALDYKLLCTASPDIDVIYHDQNFKEFVENCPDDDASIEQCALKYAELQGYEKVIELFDGYEQAYAMVKEKR